MITITLTGDGVDFNAELEAHFENLTPYGFPIFLPETGETEQILHLSTPEEGEEENSRVTLLQGSDFLYTFSNHSVSGTIETIVLGTLGDAWDAETEDLVVDDETGLVTDLDAVITISGLNITNEAGVKGDVHDIVAGLMGGGIDGTTVDADPVLAVIWGEGHDLTGTSGDDSYVGTDYRDIARGLEGDDTLTGAGGNDKLLGGSGDDDLTGGAGKDLIRGGKGADTLIGNGGNDRLFGDAGADVLSGGNGNDTLSGGKGADVLTGGKGADTFVFATTKEAHRDTITDFDSSEGDVIDLSGIDAQTDVSGDQSFTLIGDADFSGTAGELRVWQTSSGTQIAGDVDGDGVQDFRITLTGEVDLTASDFLL